MAKFREFSLSTGVGMEVIEVLRFLSSLPLAGTGRTEGGEKTQPFKRFHSRLPVYIAWHKAHRPVLNTDIWHELGAN